MIAFGSILILNLFDFEFLTLTLQKNCFFYTLVIVLVLGDVAGFSPDVLLFWLCYCAITKIFANFTLKAKYSWLFHNLEINLKCLEVQNLLNIIHLILYMYTLAFS